MPIALTPATGPDDSAPARPPLRVAVVTETYPPEVNGVACSIAHVVAGLLTCGHAVQLVRPRQAADQAPDPAAEPAVGVPVRPLQQLLLRGLPIPRYPHLKMGLPAQRLLRQHWQAWRPDVVHIATEGPLGWSALQAAQGLGLPVTSDFRTNFDAYSQHYGMGWLRRPILAYLRRFHNATLATMVPTEGLRQSLAAAGFDGLQVVGRGVDTQQFNPVQRSAALRAAWGVAPQAPVVACVGRLAPEKNLDTLLAAFAAVRSVRADSRLLLVGDGPSRAALQASCPQALFAGLRHGADLAAHYASADLFIFPSVTETYGNVTPEAMASGLPVLAFDHAAAGELIHCGHNGLLAPPNDTAAFLAQARRLVTDPGLARALGAQARQTATTQGWDRIVRQVVQVMQQAQLQHRPGPAAALPLSCAGHQTAARVSSAAGTI